MRGTTGSRIRILREKRNWSQIELAKKVGINNSVLSRIEADKRPVESEELAKFAEVFEVSTDYLARRTNNPSQPVSKNSEAFLNIIELSDDEAVEKLKETFVYNGKELTDSAALEIIQFARFRLSQDKK